MFIQLYSQIGVLPLQTGGISDSKHIEYTKLFKIQDDFVIKKVVNRILFTNIITKGYRLILVIQK